MKWFSLWTKLRLQWRLRNTDAPPTVAPPTVAPKKRQGGNVAELADALRNMHPFGSRYKEGRGATVTDTNQLIGKQIDDVIKLYTVREVKRDGKSFFIEEDKRLDRCNVIVNQDRIVGVEGFY